MSTNKPYRADLTLTTTDLSSAIIEITVQRTIPPEDEIIAPPYRSLTYRFRRADACRDKRLRYFVGLIDADGYHYIGLYRPKAGVLTSTKRSTFAPTTAEFQTAQYIINRAHDKYKFTHDKIIITCIRRNEKQLLREARSHSVVPAATVSEASAGAPEDMAIAHAIVHMCEEGVNSEHDTTG